MQLSIFGNKIRFTCIFVFAFFVSSFSFSTMHAASGRAVAALAAMVPQINTLEQDAQRLAGDLEALVARGALAAAAATLDQIRQKNDEAQALKGQTTALNRTAGTTPAGRNKTAIDATADRIAQILAAAIGALAQARQAQAAGGAPAAVGPGQQPAVQQPPAQGGVGVPAKVPVAGQQAGQAALQRQQEEAARVERERQAALAQQQRDELARQQREQQAQAAEIRRLAEVEAQRQRERLAAQQQAIRRLQEIEEQRRRDEDARRLAEQQRIAKQAEQAAQVREAQRQQEGAQQAAELRQQADQLIRELRDRSTAQALAAIAQAANVQAIGNESRNLRDAIDRAQRWLEDNPNADARLRQQVHGDREAARTALTQATEARLRALEQAQQAAEQQRQQEEAQRIQEAAQRQRAEEEARQHAVGAAQTIAEREQAEQQARLRVQTAEAAQQRITRELAELAANLRNAEQDRAAATVEIQGHQADIALARGNIDRITRAITALLDLPDVVRDLHADDPYIPRLRAGNQAQEAIAQQAQAAVAEAERRRVAAAATVAALQEQRPARELAEQQANQAVVAAHEQLRIAQQATQQAREAEEARVRAEEEARRLAEEERQRQVQEAAAHKPPQPAAKQPAPAVVARIVPTPEEGRLVGIYQQRVAARRRTNLENLDDDDLEMEVTAQGGTYVTARNNEARALQSIRDANQALADQLAAETIRTDRDLTPALLQRIRAINQPLADQLAREADERAGGGGGADAAPAEQAEEEAERTTFERVSELRTLAGDAARAREELERLIEETRRPTVAQSQAAQALAADIARRMGGDFRIQADDIPHLKLVEGSEDTFLLGENLLPYALIRRVVQQVQDWQRTMGDPEARDRLEEQLGRLQAAEQRAQQDLEQIEDRYAATTDDEATIPARFAALTEQVQDLKETFDLFKATLTIAGGGNYFDDIIAHHFDQDQRTFGLNIQSLRDRLPDLNWPATKERLILPALCMQLITQYNTYRSGIIEKKKARLKRDRAFLIFRNYNTVISNHSDQLKAFNNEYEKVLLQIGKFKTVVFKCLIDVLCKAAALHNQAINTQRKYIKVNYEAPIAERGLELFLNMRQADHPVAILNQLLPNFIQTTCWKTLAVAFADEQVIDAGGGRRALCSDFFGSFMGGIFFDVDPNRATHLPIKVAKEHEPFVSACKNSVNSEINKKFVYPADLTGAAHTFIKTLFIPAALQNPNENILTTFRSVLANNQRVAGFRQIIGPVIERQEFQQQITALLEPHLQQARLLQPITTDNIKNAYQSFGQMMLFSLTNQLPAALAVPECFYSFLLDKMPASRDANLWEWMALLYDYDPQAFRTRMTDIIAYQNGGLDSLKHYLARQHVGLDQNDPDPDGEQLEEMNTFKRDSTLTDANWIQELILNAIKRDYQLDENLVDTPLKLIKEGLFAGESNLQEADHRVKQTLVHDLNQLFTYLNTPGQRWTGTPFQNITDRLRAPDARAALLLDLMHWFDGYEFKECLFGTFIDVDKLKENVTVRDYAEYRETVQALREAIQEFLEDNRGEEILQTDSKAVQKRKEDANAQKQERLANFVAYFSGARAYANTPLRVDIDLADNTFPSKTDSAHTCFHSTDIYLAALIASMRNHLEMDPEAELAALQARRAGDVDAATLRRALITQAARNKLPGGAFRFKNALKNHFLPLMVGGGAFVERI